MANASTYDPENSSGPPQDILILVLILLSPMVLLFLTPLKGNASGSKSWPFNGYFALSQVSTHGTVRTRQGDDTHNLMASKLTIAIRCYESRTLRLGVVHTNVLFNTTKVLWQAPEGQQYAPLGDVDLPFRLSLPPDIEAPSTCHMQEHRVFWRLEAGGYTRLITHAPLVGQGTRQAKAYDLNFVRHSAPPPLYSSPSSSATLATCDANTVSNKLPSCSYDLSTPNYALGPEDALPISLRIRPGAASTAVTRVALSVERRVVFKDPSKTNNVLPFPSNQLAEGSGSPSPLPTPPSSAKVDEQQQEKNGSSEEEAELGEEEQEEDGSDVATLTGPRKEDPFASTETLKPPIVVTGTTSAQSTGIPSSPPPASPEATSFPFSILRSGPKTLTQTIASIERTKGELNVDKDGDGALVYSADMMSAIPLVKPGHWALGETMKTALVSVRFFVRVKVTLTSPSKSSTPSASNSNSALNASSSSSSSSSSSTISERISIPSQEIYIVGINTARRAYVRAKLDELVKLEPGSVKRSRSAHMDASFERPDTSTPRHHRMTDVSGEEEPRKRRHKDDGSALPSPPSSPRPSDGLATRPSTAPTPQTKKDRTRMESSDSDDAMLWLSGDLGMWPIRPKKQVLKSKHDSASVTPPSSSKGSLTRKFDTALSPYGGGADASTLNPQRYSEAGHSSRRPSPSPSAPATADGAATSSSSPQGSQKRKLENRKVWGGGVDARMLNPYRYATAAQSASRPSSSKRAPALGDSTAADPAFDSSSSNEQSHQTSKRKLNAHALDAPTVSRDLQKNISGRPKTAVNATPPPTGFGASSKGFKRGASVGAIGTMSPTIYGLTERMWGLMDTSGAAEDAMVEASGEDEDDEGGSSSSSRRGTPAQRETTPSPFMYAPPPVASPPAVSQMQEVVVTRKMKDGKEIRKWEEQLGRVESSSKKRTKEMIAGSSLKRSSPAAGAKPPRLPILEYYGPSVSG
ncbi:hypothetical protein FRB97_003068 [Tulasnella sp. 331]|nr:hypothetical protein FRB97_003068 [Tulasnella sp. 331]